MLLPSMMVDIILQMTGASNQDTLRILRARSDRGFDLVNKTLASRSYFTGSSLTAADIIMLFPLTTMRHFVPRTFRPIRTFAPICNGIGCPAGVSAGDEEGRTDADAAAGLTTEHSNDARSRADLDTLPERVRALCDAPVHARGGTRLGSRAG